MKEEEKEKGRHPSQESKYFQKLSKKNFFFLTKETFLFGPSEPESGNHPRRLILQGGGLKIDEIVTLRRIKKKSWPYLQG